MKSLAAVLNDLQNFVKYRDIAIIIGEKSEQFTSIEQGFAKLSVKENLKLIVCQRKSQYNPLSKKIAL